jgi:uncharacterized lipoprotein YajG
MVLLVVGGCAYIDQNLKVSPIVEIASVDIGAGKKVCLRIVDDREEQLIGKRAGGYGIGMAKISTDQDLAELLKNIISDGLRKKGFEPVAENETLLVMRVELRALAYDTAVGLWTGGNIGKAVVKVVASKPSGKTFEKSYRGQKEIRTIFVGSQETNSKVINGALDEVIKKVFEDKELLNFLAA